MNKPLVSIGIPTYNRPKELRIALDSVIKQTYKNIEIIVSDNCSTTPDTETLCREYVKKDSRIKYFRQEKNLGIGGNGQFLINTVNGEYTLILCDDDWISGNFIEEGVKTFLEHDDCSAVYGTTLLHDSDYQVIEKTCFRNIDDDDFLDRIPVLIENTMSYRLATALVKTDALKSIEEYGKNRCSEDHIYMSKILYFGKLKILPDIIYHKLNNGASKDLETLKKSFNMPELTHENFFETVALINIDAMLYDDFFVQRVDRQKRIKLALKLYEGYLARRCN